MAVKKAMIILYSLVLMPVACAKLSSNVTANILFKNSTNNTSYGDGKPDAQLHVLRAHGGIAAKQVVI